MKEYRTEMVSTYLSFTYALDTTINYLIEDGWQLESMQALQPNYDESERRREALLLFSRDRKEQK